MYQLMMKARDEDFSHFLSDVYKTKAEAEKWQEYLAAQPQNKDYEFLIVEVAND